MSMSNYLVGKRVSKGGWMEEKRITEKRTKGQPVNFLTTITASERKE